MKTITQYEVTDTFGGEANYSWVERGIAPSKEGEDFSDLAAAAQNVADRALLYVLTWEGRQ